MDTAENPKVDKTLLKGIALRHNRFGYDEVKPTVGYDYDGYYCSGCFGCETGEDYCRGSVYEGLRVSEIKADELLDQIFVNKSGKKYPDVFYKVLQTSGILDELTWEVSSEPDYYGDVVVGPDFIGPVNPFTVVRKMYQEAVEPETVDPHGVLNFLRAKDYKVEPGTDITEAVRNYIVDAGLYLTYPVWSAARLSKNTDVVAWEQFREQLTKKKNPVELILPQELKKHARAEPLPKLGSEQLIKQNHIIGIVLKNPETSNYFLIVGAEYYDALVKKIKDGTQYTADDYKLIVLY